MAEEHKDAQFVPFAERSLARLGGLVNQDFVPHDAALGGDNVRHSSAPGGCAGVGDEDLVFAYQ